jgi:hypothetical protein
MIDARSDISALEDQYPNFGLDTQSVETRSRHCPYGRKRAFVGENDGIDSVQVAYNMPSLQTEEEYKSGVACPQCFFS